MCLVTCIGRVIIVVLNVIFVIVSFVMLVVGIVLKYFSDNEFVKNAEKEMKNAIKQGMSSSGVGDQNSVDSFSLNETLSGVAIALIVIGAFLLAISIFGMIGGWCKVKCMLLGYVAILSVLLFTQIVVSILFLATNVGSDVIKKQLREKTLPPFKGLDGKNLESFAWNGVMFQFDCCGIDNYKDFELYATSWENTGITTSGGGVPQNIDMPFACCKTLDSSTVNTCAKETSTNNWKNVGCFEKIWSTSVADPLMTSIVLLIAFGSQLLLIVFAILLYRDLKKDKVGIA